MLGKLNEIDEILSGFEDWMHGQDGKNCSLARKLVSELKAEAATIKEVENLMERWHLARDNDNETLQGINDALVKIGLLSWFNKPRENT